MSAKTLQDIFRASKSENTAPASGETRDCLDPWFQPLLQTNGDVSPCCWYYAPLGNLNQQSFDEIVNNEAFQQLRRQLLTGDLPEFCIACPGRGITTPRNLLDKLHAKKAL